MMKNLHQVIVVLPKNYVLDEKNPKDPYNEDFKYGMVDMEEETTQPN